MRSRRGFTLIELIIGGALLVVVGLIILALLLWALDGSAAGEVQQLVQQDARTALEDLRGDLSQSVVPPLGTTGTLLLPSGVIIPTSYQTSPDPFSRGIPNSAAPLQLASNNIVAFTAPNKASSSFIPTLLFDPIGTPEFSLIVYYVTDSTGRDVTVFQTFDTDGNPLPGSAKGAGGADQSAEGGHILWKNVYNVTATGPLVNTGLGGLWTVDMSLLNGPNGSAASVGASPNDPVSQSQAVTLKPGDACFFSVHHANLNNGPDPTFQTIADRHAFQIDVIMQRQVPLHLGQSQIKRVHMSDTATMRTFQ